MTDQPSSWAAVRRLLAASSKPYNADLPETVPWSDVARLAQNYGFGPLLHAAIQENGLDVPREIGDPLQEAYYQLAAANAVRFQELARVLTTLSAAGIPVLVLKGALLAETVYGNLALRPMSDLDLLIPRERIHEIPQILAPLGYRLNAGEAGYSFAYDTLFCGEIILYKETPVLPVVLDVHWHLLAVEWFHHTARVDLEALWERVCPLSIDGTPAQQLCPEDNLLHLCLHAGISHSYVYLLNLIDIDRTIAACQDLDWDRFLDRARDFQVRSAVYFGLHFTRDLFDTPIPDRVLDDLSPGRFRCWGVHHLADPQRLVPRVQPPLSRRSRYLLHLTLIDSLPGMLRLARYLFLPSGEWLATRYGLTKPSTVLLARFWHPLRAAGLAVAAVARLAQERLLHRSTQH
jgi:hypothetical protein